ncbi:hypothetical protein [Marinomonas sp.]|uniref:hypothetical protein n=1 Tax=Marinomonas sp. TaxID=1904862 RepID=UPI003A922279
MALDKEYWNIPKPSEDFLTTQGTNLTVFVDHADNALVWGLGASDVTAIAGVFIAAIALFGSLQQGHKAKKHNQLSIQPHLIISSSLQDDGKLLTFWLENCGLGPAVINDYSLKINDVLVADKSRYIGSNVQDTITTEILKLIARKTNSQSLKDKVLMNSQSAEVKTFVSSEVIPVGVSYKVIELKLDTRITNDAFDWVVGNCIQSVNYSDFYGKSFTISQA